MLRIFKLGSLDPLVIPGKTAPDQLRDALKQYKETGQEIVWGPDIEVLYVAENLEELEVINNYHVLRPGKLLSNTLSELPEEIKIGDTESSP